MTEQEWMACGKPRQMLMFLGAGASERKARLCAVACCYRNPATISDDLAHRLVLTAEAYADGLVDDEALRAATSYEADGCPALAAGFPSIRYGFVHQAALAADLVCWWRADPVANRRETSAVLRKKVAVEQEAIAEIVRDIFGNPFRPVALDPAWLTSTVVALSRGIYDERAFDRMPILADALQDAGCDSDDVLNHCRGPGPHVRGCWVVDLLLRKT